MGSRKEDNRKHWEWGRYFSIVTMLALAPMRLDCVFLLPKLQSGLFQYVQLISFQLFLNSVRSALTVPHSGPQFWHLPHTAEPLLWVEADWRPSAVLKWQAWGCSLSSFPTTVVSHSQIPSWESYVILDGACYCCTRPEVLCGQGQGGGVECGSLLGAAWFLLQPGLAGVSRCCWTGSLLVKAVPWVVFFFFFFLLSLCSLPLTTARLHLMGVQGNQPLSMNWSHCKFKGPWRSECKAIAFPHTDGCSEP